VSIATVDDAKKLYSGFDLVAPKTSVSMTINGPAPIMLAFFLNAAIDQQARSFMRARGRLAVASELPAKAVRGPYAGPLPAGRRAGLLLLGRRGDRALRRGLRPDPAEVLRRTVQADILKEDQAQNTCIFSTEFALRMMGDIQQYFIERSVRNFYSVTISGYHIAEAGANPITQLAFTLANGFTFVEYYLSRGMKVDDFAPNLSFFFSNGSTPSTRSSGAWRAASGRRHEGPLRRQRAQPEAQVPHPDLGPLAARAGDGLQRHPHHAPGAAGHRRQLQLAAHQRLRRGLTTPTEASVRRAMAIQLIINRELGLTATRTRCRALHRRGADGPRGGGRARGVRPDRRARRCAGGDGDAVPARPDPGGVAVLRAPEARRHAADRGREPLRATAAAGTPAAPSWASLAAHRSSSQRGPCGVKKAAACGPSRSTAAERTSSPTS
jgi:methylmalonyl-CoA mutase